MGPRLVASPIFALGSDKCVSSYQWILQVDWWVVFVLRIYLFQWYIYARITLYNILFMLIVIWTRYLFLVSGPPTFVSRHHLLFQYWRQLHYKVQSEAFFAIDRLYLSRFCYTFYSVQASKGTRPNSV